MQIPHKMKEQVSKLVLLLSSSEHSFADAALEGIITY